MIDVMKISHEKKGVIDFGDDTAAFLVWPLARKDIKTFEVPAGGQVLHRRLAMQVPFRGFYLWIESSRPGVELVSLRIGVMEQLMMSIPVEIFEPTNYSHPLTLPAADAGQVIDFGFRGPDDGAPVTLRCLLDGIYLPRESES